MFFTAGVTVVALAVVSWLAFGTESWQAFFHWMPMFSQAFLTEGKAPWWKLQSIFALVRYFGGTEQLAWVFQWIMTASVARGAGADVAQPRALYALKAAALAAGTLLITPYLFHVRRDGAGDRRGLPGPHRTEAMASAATNFRRSACRCAADRSFIRCSARRLGFAATLIVAGLVAAPVRSVVAARACADAGCRER